MSFCGNPEQLTDQQAIEKLFQEVIAQKAKEGVQNYTIPFGEAQKIRANYFKSKEAKVEIKEIPKVETNQDSNLTEVQ